MTNFNIYHRRDGRWEGRISRNKKENNKRKYLYVLARTREAVVEKMEKIRQREQPRGRCAKTISVLFSEWYHSVQHRIKESTAANYTMKAQKHILPNFGDKSIDSIVQNDIYSFIEAKQKEGFSTRYISDIIILMKSIYKYAVRTYHIFNPMDGVILPKKKTPEIDLLDESEQSKLQRYINNNQNYSTLGVALSMSTGIRIGELCALQWKDIDLEKRILTVRKTMQRIQCSTEISKTKLIITDPKNESSRRRIPISDCIMFF
mgnify:FL=1